MPIHTSPIYIFVHPNADQISAYSLVLAELSMFVSMRIQEVRMRECFFLLLKIDIAF